MLEGKIKLGLATVQDARLVHHLKYHAFLPLYRKYHDETSPVNETLEKTKRLLMQQETDYYLIYNEGIPVGAVRVLKRESGYIISPIFLIPEQQNKKIGQEVFILLFQIYKYVKCWKITTILQETGDCHLYEKMGFVPTGEEHIVNSDMTLIDYIRKEETNESKI